MATGDIGTLPGGNHHSYVDGMAPTMHDHGSEHQTVELVNSEFDDIYILYITYT